MKNLRKILFIGIPLFAVLLLIVYSVLGGFEKPEVKISNSPGYIILGKRLTGEMDSQELKKTYRDAQEKFSKGVLKGVFSVKHFHEPDQKDGKVDAVIGVIVKDSSLRKPEGYRYFLSQKGPIAQVTIQSHFAVAPSPEEVNSAVKALADSKGMKVGEGSLEKYYGSSHLVVEIPLIK